MRTLQRHPPQQVNTGSMADIAFLLLIFFLVTTTILQEKGLMLGLPPEADKLEVMPVNDRNVFNISINANNQFLIENEPRADLSGLRQEVKSFITNPTNASDLSESPQKAVISVKTSRGTDYAAFISVLDELKGAYYEVYGERVGLTGEEYRQLDLKNPQQLKLYEEGKADIPMNISVAEPNK